MYKNSNRAYIWNARSLENQAKSGVIESFSKQQAKLQLQQQEYFRIVIKPVPAAVLVKTLTTRQLLVFLNSLILMLKAGLPINEALDLMLKETNSVWMKYICSRLIELLQEGKSIKDAFSRMSPLFPPFFLSMVQIVELSGQLVEGCRSAFEFYRKQEEHQRELKRITRYPKIVLAAAMLLITAVIVFIVPMFQSIYLMFGNDLPLPTKILVAISTSVHAYAFTILLMSAIGCLWFVLPVINRFNPILGLIKKLGGLLASWEDPYIYALAMKMQLENGQPISEATRNAASCLSARNRIHCTVISEKLDAGCSLTEAFQSSRWFPSVYRQLLSSAEIAGQLGIGFTQISHFLEQKRTDRFAFWSKFLEPMMMILLGSLIMLVLLAIYLPIFDLGNRVG